jgi:hypothetical protein
MPTILKVQKNGKRIIRIYKEDITPERAGIKFTPGGYAGH